MNESISPKNHSDMNMPKKISQSDLAEFLIKLSDIYASAEYGNQALSDALHDLALNIIQKNRIGANTKQIRANKNIPELSPDEIKNIKELSHESIKNFLSDERKTKNDLLNLAYIRFSMPVSQLKRMKTDDLKHAITAALLHESSIEILSEESIRDGTHRNS